MNAEHVYFFAQSLDNKSPDIIAVGRKLLSTEDTLVRDQAMGKMTTISSKGEVVYRSNAGEVSAILDQSGEAFLLEIVPLEKDTIGRKAPIICFGDIPDASNENWIVSLVSELNNFIDEVGRKTNSENDKWIREALHGLIKKKQKSLNKNVKVFIAGMTVVYLWFLALSVSHGSDLISFLIPPLGVLSYLGIVFRRKIAFYLKSALRN